MSIKFPNVGQRCEWGKAKYVIMHEPGIETLFGVLNPYSANFLYPFNIKKAIEEHRRFRKTLESLGVKVFDIRELFKMAYSKDGGELLKRDISRFIDVSFSDEISPKDRRRIFEVINQFINDSDSDTLYNIAVLRPRLKILYNRDALDPTTLFNTIYETRPLHNLSYVRDPMITTERGIVIGRAKLEFRRGENDLLDLILKRLGIHPIYRIRRGFLEGGDFLPAGEFVLQGVGLLTNLEGVLDALEHGVYGDVEVALVIDPAPRMEEMHLDGYLNILTKDLILLSEDKVSGEREPEVRVYKPVSGGESYRYVSKYNLRRYLKDKGFDIINVPRDEHLRMAENIFLIRDGRFIGLNRITDKFKSLLESLGLKGIYLDMDELTKGYGGPHCLTQAIVREGC